MKVVAFIICLGLAGCVSVPQRDHVTVLLAHPQAKAAAKVAPDFFKAAMNVIAEQDYELNQRK